MIYVTGDTHREFSRFSRLDLTKDDMIIVLGDVGIGYEYAQFLLGKRGTYRNLVFAGSARHGFGFGANQHDIAVFVCCPFGSLDVIPD